MCAASSLLMEGTYMSMIRGCKVQVAGHYFNIIETTQTFTKMLSLGLNIIQSIVFGTNVIISKGLV